MCYSTVEINLSQLKKNVANLQSQKICAMVKANAYGVGLERVCSSLKNQVDFFGVATLEEALKIRKFDSTTKILIVGMCNNFAKAEKNNISVTLENEKQLKKILKFPNLKFHIKINTGMNRFGIKKLKIFKKILKIIKNNNFFNNFEGIFTHFYFSENKKIIKKQLNKFKKYLFFVKKNKNFNPIIHFGGGGVLSFPQIANWQNCVVREGFNLYKNIISIHSKVLKTFWVKRGEKVGYLNGFVATKKTKIAIVPLGYADGVNRKLGNRGFVKIKNQKCKIIGNVCMDCFFVDVTKIDCKIGEKVDVFYDVFDWAKICKTIAYEILTSLNFSRMKIKEI